MSKISFLALVLINVHLTGCSTFGCKGFPDSPICKSSVDAYHFTDDQNSKVEEAALSGVPFLLGHPQALEGIRTDSRVMRIWVAPWEDRDGDLQTASYILTEPNRKGWEANTHKTESNVLHPLQVATRQPISSKDNQ